MDTQPSLLTPLSKTPSLGQSSPAPISAAGAILFALEDSVRLLFRPFEVRRWIKLGLLCLFLGGGTPTAAFQWSLGALPADLRLPNLLIRTRQFVEQHPSLIFLAVVAALALGIGVLYLRSLFRFMLVDSLIKREVSLARAWFALRPLGESYFRWLASTLAGLVAAFGLLVILALPGLQAASASGPGRVFATALLALMLSLIVLVGLAVALVIMLTDDLVVPLMYADRLPLRPAWKLLWQKMRADPASFAVYILLRFLLSVGVSVGVLLFLVPLLVGLFSGSIIVAAVIVLALHLVGLIWVWSLPTMGLTILALLLLATALIALLSAVGMPGQVFLQDFSLRFIAARSPSLSALCALVDLEGEVE